MPPSSTDRIAEIEAWLRACLGKPVELRRIEGGISPRSFYRVRLDEARTAIVMDVPPETPDVAFAAKLGRPWPFLEVRSLLAGAGVRVPTLLIDAHAQGLLLVEDLGRTLAEHLAERPDEREALYQTAAVDLARAQAALHPLPAGSIVGERAFDEDLLGQELDHFRQWALAARGETLDAAETSGFETARRFLVRTIAALPRGFVHRDYQSRNLLVAEDPEGRRLGWIDFQDALLGPRAYDLVALLCDSYQPFDRAFAERRLDDYARARGLDAEGRQALGRELDLVAVQRKLKDAGRFVFVERTRGDPSYLPFVGPTLEIARQALERLGDVPELDPLRALTARAARAAAAAGPPRGS